MAIDPITLEILVQALISVVREMRATVMRTASSVAIFEAKDFSCGLFAPDSQVVAQSEDIGSHVVPLPWSVRVGDGEVRGELAPGDVILMNDPYAGGTHLNDVTIIYPVFDGERLLFFPAVREHWPDVGGMVPGSMSGKATEIYQEGVRIPPIKIYQAGKLNDAAMDLLLANMRVPEERLGDFQAGIAACRVAEARIRDLCRRYGIDPLLEAVRIDLDRSEARMRACIRVCRMVSIITRTIWRHFPGGGFEPLLLPLALTIDGDRMIADFTGASPQVPVPVNSTLAVSAAGVFIAVKSVFDPAAPMNQGSLRPIEVIAPLGTIVNVQPPAPAGSHGEIRKRVLAVMIGALSQVVPDRVAGDLCRTSFHNLLGGYDTATRREWVHYEWSGGGNGAFAEADGPSAMATIDWGDLTTVQPSEVIEARHPLMVEILGVGCGFRRGGAHHAADCRCSGCCAFGRPMRATRCWRTARCCRRSGVLGGRSGVPVASWVRHADGSERDFDMPGKVAGEYIVRGGGCRAAVGGGWRLRRSSDPRCRTGCRRSAAGADFVRGGVGRVRAGAGG